MLLISLVFFFTAEVYTSFLSQVQEIFEGSERFFLDIP